MIGKIAMGFVCNTRVVGNFGNNVYIFRSYLETDGLDKACLPKNNLNVDQLRKLWIFGACHQTLKYTLRADRMSKYGKLLGRILEGRSDANIRFDDLRQLLLRLGFEERTRGSHHVFRKEGVEEKINLQRDDDKAKVYQVRQVRSIILKYKLEVGD